MPLLTALSVTQALPRVTRFEIPDSRVVGLMLVIQPSGAKSWAVRYRAAGRPRKLTLGPFPRIELADARKLASAALREVASGNDPAGTKSETRRKVAAGLDREQQFGAVWERYLSEYVRPHLKPSTAKEMERVGNTLLLPKFRRRTLEEIAPHDVKALMNEQKKRGAPIQANKVFASVRGFFNWCKRELILNGPSPCDGLQKPEVEKARDRILTDQEIKWFWRACHEIGFPFGPMHQLLLLTGTRRDEARALTERELDLEARTWTLPSGRTKNGREHVVHLADATVAVLKAVPRINGKAGYLFTTTGETPPSGFSRVKTRIDALMAEYAKEEGKETPPPWVVHDLRRTAASGMARLGISLPVIERALNHISGSFGGIVGVYQRHEFSEEKAAAFDAWAAHVTSLAEV